MQRGMIGRNADGPEDRRIVFRVGINIGDILSDGGDIFGDGVNVAARLEALCEPGGVCISRAGNEQIRDKLSLAFADLGERTVKNIARSIGVFGLAAEDIALLPRSRLVDRRETEAERRWRSGTGVRFGSDQMPVRSRFTGTERKRLLAIAHTCGRLGGFGGWWC
jgi:Adenylate and Guanylate cyclase catalytic domain